MIRFSCINAIVVLDIRRIEALTIALIFASITDHTEIRFLFIFLLGVGAKANRKSTLRRWRAEEQTMNSRKFNFAVLGRVFDLDTQMENKIQAYL